MGPPTWGYHAPSEGFHNPFYRIRGTPKRGQLVCVVLGSNLYEGPAHFDLDLSRSSPCVGLPHCPYCRAGLGSRRYGYVAAQLLTSRELFVLELTPGALNQLSEVIKDGAGLRGRKLALGRRRNKDGGVSKTAKVEIKAGGMIDPLALPSDFDVRPHLRELWGWMPGVDAPPQHAEDCQADNEKEGDAA